ncbi:MAG: hypothetical protein R2725_03285 [Solirubrobacterales bacterium]
MTRNLKALGLALVAVFAMSALVAQAASAHEFTSDSENGKTVLTGADEPGTNDVFTVGGAEVICENASFAGTADESEVNEVTVHPEYSNCTFAGNEAFVRTNMCNYTFHGATVENHAVVDVAECEGEAIEIEVPVLGITATVGEQADLGGVHYTDLGSSVTVEATVSKIHTTCDGDEFWCDFIFGEETTGFGEYSSEDVVVGYEDNGIEEGESTTPIYKEGGAVDLSVVPG